MKRQKHCILTVLLLAFCAVSAYAQQNRVSISLKNATLEQFFKAIEKQTDYQFSYDDYDISKEKFISITKSNVPLSDVLSQVLPQKGLAYQVISDKSIAVFKQKAEKVQSQKAVPISGSVKDNNGEPVIGASVIVKGKQLRGTSTDLDGHFTIDAAPGTVLEVSSIGYRSKNVTVGNGTNLAIKLDDDKAMLDEVVVVGYGTQRKRDLTGSIAHINALDIESEAPTAVQDIIRGGVAGVTAGLATDVSGQVDIQIRGKNTISAGSTPLIVLDGAVFSGSMIEINPNDVESIDVLKDASSAAIYGAKAASGVIMITTKKGSKTGAPAIKFNANVGIARAARISKLLDGEGFIDFRQEYFYGLLSDSELVSKQGIYDDPRTLQGVDQLTWYNYTQKTPVSTLPDETTLVKTWLSRIGFREAEVNNYLAGIETNWDDILFPRALQQDYTVSVSDRNDKTTYYASLAYSNREGTVAEKGYRNYKGRINFDTNVTKWLTTGVNAMFAVEDNSDLGAQLTYRLGMTPYCTNEIDNPDSPYRYYPTGDASYQNPFLQQRYTDRSDYRTSFNFNLYAKVKLPFGFEFQSNFSPRVKWRDYFTHQSSENPKWAKNGGNTTRNSYKWYNWQIDNVLRWNKTIGEHHFEATFLQNAEKNQYWMTSAKGKLYTPSDFLTYHYLDAATSPTVASSDEYSTATALMARLFYSWKDRYMLTASVRRDGYSAFGVLNPYGTFPSVALGWVFSEENFMKSQDWLNYGKFRVSYGLNGNRDIGIYQALSHVTTGVYEHIDSKGAYKQVNMLSISQLGNAGLKWERTASLNFGLDYALFDNFVDGSIDYYSNKTSDLLINRTLPTVTGYSSILSNIGLLGNKGFEVNANFHFFRNTNFTWDSSVNVSHNRRQILKLFGVMEDVYDDNGNVIGQKEADDKVNWWFIGHDPFEVIDYEDGGVWQLGEEAEAAKYGCKPGDFHQVDQNNDGVLNTEDVVFSGHTTTPKWNVSWRNNFTICKNFSVSFMMYGKLGMWGAFGRANNNEANMNRINIWALPRWTKDNPTNEYARLNSYNVYCHWVNRSLVRMDNVAFNYAIPKDFLKKIHLSEASLSLNLRNPFCITKWPCGDPENLDNPDYSVKSYTMGLNITF